MEVRVVEGEVATVEEYSVGGCSAATLHSTALIRAVLLLLLPAGQAQTHEWLQALDPQLPLQLWLIGALRSPAKV